MTIQIALQKKVEQNPFYKDTDFDSALREKQRLREKWRQKHDKEDFAYDDGICRRGRRRRLDDFDNDFNEESWQ